MEYGVRSVESRLKGPRLILNARSCGYLTGLAIGQCAIARDQECCLQAGGTP